MTIVNKIIYSARDENVILNYLKIGDLVGLENAVKKIIDYNRKEGLSHKYIVLLFNALYDTGLRYIREKGDNCSSFIIERDYIVLNDMTVINWDYRERIEILMDLYENIIKGSLNQDENRPSEHVLLMMQYVEENYYKDIDIIEVAGFAGISFKYASRLFKEKVGQNFSDYVNLVRVKKAKELLKNTDIKVEEVFRKVGFYSRATFFRVFKKLKKITPKQYREVMQ